MGADNCSSKEMRSMVATVALAREWDAQWLELLRRTGEAVSDADAERLADVRDELDELADGRHRPVYGALIVNLRNILESLDVVANVQPVEIPT